AVSAPVDQRDEGARLVASLVEEYMGAHWGDGTTTRLLLYGAPGDEATDQLIARFERNSATPAVAQAVYRRGGTFDPRCRVGGDCPDTRGRSRGRPGHG